VEGEVRRLDTRIAGELSSYFLGWLWLCLALLAGCRLWARLCLPLLAGCRLPIRLCLMAVEQPALPLLLNFPVFFFCFGF
jgi:hypothetical protein